MKKPSSKSRRAESVAQKRTDRQKEHPRAASVRRLAVFPIEPPLAFLLESTADLLWSVDTKDFKLTAYNLAFADCVRKTCNTEVRLGMRVEDFCSPGRIKSWKQLYKKALEEDNVECDFELLSPANTFHLVFHRVVRNRRPVAISVFGRDVTQRKWTEEALRKSEEKFGKAFMEGPMPLTLTRLRDAVYLDVNNAFEQSTGYTRQEVIGRTPFDLELWVHPEQRSRLMAKVKEKGHIGNVEVDFRTKGGEIRHALGSASLIEIEGEPCMISVLNDITARKRAVRALTESEQRLHLAIEAGGMFTFEWDPKTDALLCPRENSEVLGLPAGHVQHTGRKFIDSIHPDDRERFLGVIHSLSSERPAYKVTYRLIRPDQSVVWLEESGRVFFDSAGGLTRVLGMATDVTAAKQAESALRQLSGKLINAQEEERRHVARELHDNIGQELALLTMQAQHIDAEALKKTAHAEVHDLYKRIQDIAVKVNNLSHRIHSSELEFLGLNIAAERLCRDFAKQSGIEIEYLARDFPSSLENSKALCFYRVIQEALQNVVKHSKASHVRVSLQGNLDSLTLEIHDDGIGFDAEQAEAGPGLGVVGMRERMNLIGGTFSIHSILGSGTAIQCFSRLNPRKGGVDY